MASDGRDVYCMEVRETMGKLMDRGKDRMWKLSMKGLPRGPHVSRYYLYQHLQMLGPSLPQQTG